MLLTMRGADRGARAPSATPPPLALDRAHARPTRPSARAAHERAALLTPVAKAFATDIGVEVASLGVQVHGGMGYIEETGAAQHYRDARIAAIYEGTNGIQAIDLVTRKLPLSGGATVKAYIAELRHTVEAIERCQRPGASARPASGWTSRSTASSAPPHWLLGRQQNDRDALLAGATPYLRLFALAAGGCAAGREALAATADGGGSRCGRAHRAGAVLRREHRGQLARARTHRVRRRRQRE